MVSALDFEGRGPGHRRTGSYGLGWAVTLFPEKYYTMPESLCCTNALKSQ